LIPEVENSVLWKKLLTAKQSNGKDMGCFMSASGVKESTAGKKGDAVLIYFFFSFFLN